MLLLFAVASAQFSTNEILRAVRETSRFGTQGCRQRFPSRRSLCSLAQRLIDLVSENVLVGDPISNIDNNIEASVGDDSKTGLFEKMTLLELVEHFGINKNNWIIIILKGEPAMKKRIDKNKTAKRNCIKMMKTPNFMKDEKIKKACEEDPSKMEKLANKKPKDLDAFLADF